MQIKELAQKGAQYVGQTLTLNGWVRSLRKSKKFSFINLTDGTTLSGIQVVADGDLEGYEELVKSNTGTALSLTGEIVSSQGKNQAVEMHVRSFEIVGTVPEDYPLQKKATSLEFLREVAHLRARTNTLGAVFRVRHALSFATHEFFHQRGFFHMHTPIITASDCEGAGELFRVSTFDPQHIPLQKDKTVDYDQDYFARPTFLTVSGQLEGETHALALSNIYTFGPTFRSENSNTPRHLAEFWMIEPEMAFADLSVVADLAQDYLKYLISYALKNCGEDLAFFNERYDDTLLERLSHVASADFQRLPYTEAIAILEAAAKEEKFDYPVSWGMDLQTEHERYLAEKHFQVPVIVTDYPKDIKAFYMKVNPDNKTVAAMDLLVPGVGELMGGSQREDDLEILKQRMSDHGLNHDDYWWYLDLRRMGGCPHGGFGMGFERAVMYVTGMKNIRDVIAYPRFPRNASF